MHQNGLDAFAGENLYLPPKHDNAGDQTQPQEMKKLITQLMMLLDEWCIICWAVEIFDTSAQVYPF